MTFRVVLVALCALPIFVACKRSTDSSIVGSWRGRAVAPDGLVEMAGEIRFTSDHAFTSREWDATNLVLDAGDWRVSGDKLVMNFRGESRAPDARHVELSMAMRDRDHLTLRQPSGLETILERSK